ncbi:MAG: hypothetical protein QG620_864 [Patescibacteria group bacterium]|nr:hypothetical protein [Patescibacteria group bacterium]
MGNFDLNQKVSSQLAFMLIILLGFLTAWYSVSAGQKIVENAKDLGAVNASRNAEINRELKGGR